jgi:hypothetical protein
MVLVSVTGDFDSGVLPVFYHHCESVAVHILMHDRKEVETARRLNRGIKRFCDRYGYTPLLLTLPYDEDSHASLVEAVETILKHKGNRALCFNPTEALSSTAVLLNTLLSPHGGIMLEYDRRENTINRFENALLRSESVAPMTVEEHLLFKDVALQIAPNMPEVYAREDLVRELLADTDRFMAFREAYFNEGTHAKGFEHFSVALEAYGVHDDTNYISGTIFEEYCFHLLRELPFDDVVLGAVTTFLPDTPDAFKNEFDVLCIKENHLHIVECKFRKSLKGEELVYKYDSVMDLVDEDAKAVLAVVGGENVQFGKGKKPRKIFYDGAKRRASHSDILIYQERRFDPERFKAEVAAYLGLSAS